MQHSWSSSLTAMIQCISLARRGKWLHTLCLTRGTACSPPEHSVKLLNSPIISVALYVIGSLRTRRSESTRPCRRGTRSS